MNWLAHVFLSDGEIDLRLGNLLADLVKGPDRTGMTLPFQRGMRQHQLIDIFTDSHPIVIRSRGRISSRYRRVAGILVDVFYDHFLAISWDRYSTVPLDLFLTSLYANIRASQMKLPPFAEAVLARICLEDWLGSYRHVAGIESALHRLSRRLERRVGTGFGLSSAISELESNFEGLKSDFAEFFPLLQAHVGKDFP